MRGWPGRADKYEVDLGWETNLAVYVIYEKSGGPTKDKAIAEAMLDAIKEEIASEYHRQIIVTGDFNVEPDALTAAQDLIEKKQCIDVGRHAS